MGKTTNLNWWVSAGFRTNHQRYLQLQIAPFQLARCLRLEKLMFRVHKKQLSAFDGIFDQTEFRVLISFCFNKILNRYKHLVSTLMWL